MATNFKNVVSPNIGMTPVDVVTASGSSKITVIGLSLANITDGVVVASVKLTDAEENTAYYIKDIPIPPNQSLRVVNGGEKLIIAPYGVLTIEATQDEAVDAIVSYVEVV
jgi:hypothetical protein